VRFQLFYFSFSVRSNYENKWHRFFTGSGQMSFPSSNQRCKNTVLRNKQKSQSKLGSAASPPLTAENNYATKSPFVTMACPTFTPKIAPSLRRSPSHLIHPSLDGPHSPPQTASRSSQLFSHSTVFGQTDAQTDRRSRRQVCKNTRLRSIDYIATRLKYRTVLLKNVAPTTSNADHCI